MARAGSADLPDGESKYFSRDWTAGARVFAVDLHSSGKCIPVRTQGASGITRAAAAQVTQRPGCSNFATSVKTLTTGSQATVVL